MHYIYMQANTHTNEWKITGSMKCALPFTWKLTDPPYTMNYHMLATSFNKIYFHNFLYCISSIKYDEFMFVHFSSSKQFYDYNNLILGLWQKKSQNSTFIWFKISMCHGSWKISTATFLGLCSLLFSNNLNNFKEALIILEK